MYVIDMSGSFFGVDHHRFAAIERWTLSLRQRQTVALAISMFYSFVGDSFVYYFCVMRRTVVVRAHCY